LSKPPPSPPTVPQAPIKKETEDVSGALPLPHALIKNEVEEK
jgi:hypothetical protein